MSNKLRVVHYLNQFFGGIGGEEKASVGPQVVAGAVGPGKAIQRALGDDGEVVATVICGDNYFGERNEQAADEIIQLISPYKPDVFIAGPAFDAGRYGVACGALCKAVKDRLNIPSVTGMFEENPGVEMYHKDVWIVTTGDSVRSMNEAVARMVGIATRLARGQTMGKPFEDGYFPRGNVVNEYAEGTGAQRVVGMLLKKLRGEPFETEVVQPRHLPVVPASPIRDIDSAIIALVTDGGLVPRGNPDKIEASNATKFGEYGFSGVQALGTADYDVNHGGYDTTLVKQDPNRLVPVDAMREMEKAGTIGGLLERFFATAGVSTRAEMARKFGQAIAAELKAGGVSGVILTST